MHDLITHCLEHSPIIVTHNICNIYKAGRQVMFLHSHSFTSFTIIRFFLMCQCVLVWVGVGVDGWVGGGKGDVLACVTNDNV